MALFNKKFITRIIVLIVVVASLAYLFFNENGIPGAVSENLLPKSTIQIHPNPVHDYLTIKTYPNKRPVSLEIYNLDGTRMTSHTITGEEARIDVRALKPGMYSCVVKSIEGVQTRKIIKLN